MATTIRLTAQELTVIDQLLTDAVGEEISVRENIVAERASNDVRTIDALARSDARFAVLLGLLEKVRSTG